MTVQLLRPRDEVERILHDQIQRAENLLDEYYLASINSDERALALAGALVTRTHVRLVRYGRRVFFLIRRWTYQTAAWWNHVAADPNAPALVHELLRGESVVCEQAHAEEALAWARAQPHWSDDPAPLYLRIT